MATEAQRSHGKAREPAQTYLRALERLERRRVALRALLRGGYTTESLVAATALVTEADMMMKRVAYLAFANTDAIDPDWIKRGRERRS